MSIEMNAFPALLRHRALVCALLFAIAALALAQVVAADDWPQWRGPDRDGTAANIELPATLPGDLTQLWQVEVGTGHSSPLIVGDHVYIHARQDNHEVTQALELKTGKTLWSHKTAISYRRNPAALSHGKGPKSTPVVSGNTLCTLAITARVTCYDRTNGKVRFQKDFEDRFDRAWPDFGTAMSPAVLNGKLILQVGGMKQGAVLALDPETGKELWAFNEEPPAYASPILVGSGKHAQLVTQTRNHVVSLHPETGRLLWKTSLVTAYEQNSVTAIAVDGLIVTSGLDNSIFAIKAEPDDRGLWVARTVWRNEELPMYMSSPVRFGDLVLGHSHKRKGVLFALDAKTGETLWTTEGRDGENASLVVAGDRLLVVTTDSDLRVGKVSAEGWSEEARYELADSEVWAYPALSGDQILIKDKTHLTAWAFR